MNNRKKKLILLSLFAMLLLVAGVGGAALFQNETQAQPTTQNSNATKSMFEFTGTDGWRRGPSNGTSMALFSNSSPDGTSSCFTSIEHMPGTVDINDELQKYSKTLDSTGHKATPLETKSLTIQTLDNKLQYDLHLSSVATPDGADKVMGGNALGYLQLSDGYLKILGNCNTSEELPKTFPALESIKITQAI